MSLCCSKDPSIEEHIQLSLCVSALMSLCCSKDPGIEERIQFSLRENLKDIGKRCIHELRNFIDSLRAEHTTDLF